MMSGILIIVLMALFLGVVFWAWSDKRKAEFDHLSNLPLEDDINVNEEKGDKNGHE